MLTEAGFDIELPFDTALVANEPGLEVLADSSRRIGVLIGNTRALWPRFRAACATDLSLAASHHPLDRYTEETVSRAFPGDPAWFAHCRYDGTFLPFQRLAVVVGLGAMAPTHIVIHPRFGPWFALRAVVVRGGEPPAPPAPQGAYRCTGGCEGKLAQALRGGDWRAWLAVRDACVVGRDARYCAEQIVYHYTKDHSLLR